MNQRENGESKTNTLDSKEELKAANERRIEALLEINNKYVRTERHMEQHSDITKLDHLKHSMKVQEERKNEMENLKNIIVHGRHEEVDDQQNIKRNLEFTDHYLQHHSDHMDEETRKKTEEKQEHRKEQLEFLD
ncbi:MAG: hypothetical protein K0R31_582 [Clostridiales bacterium]|jgi:hypothetical protein|nr:hypothetical protein [Clostridiales bacterium]